MKDEPGRMDGGRLSRSVPLAGRALGEAALAGMRRGPRSADAHSRNAERWAEHLGRSKGVLMKVGQMLSFITAGSAADEGFQAIYQDAFAKLQDDAPPMSFAVVRDVVESELDEPLSRLFADFATEPLAAASIGQVHAAVLPDGRRVAVKVQYPGVEQAITADLANTQLLATFVQLMRAVVPAMGNLDVRAFAAEIADRIGEEVDYELEAANQQELAGAHRGHPFIRVPEVVVERSSRRVLTMDLAEGMRYREAVGADVELRNLWGEAIFRFQIGNLRERGLLCADPHPGNYLFHADGTVTFLDFGCIRRHTVHQQQILKGITQATVAQDADLLHSRCVAAGWVNPAAAPTPAALLAWCTESMWSMIAPQPHTYTADVAANTLARQFSPRGPHADILRKISAPSEYVSMTRLDVGLTAVLAGLRATGPWNAIREEWDSAGPPATAYGEQALVFRAVRR